jgi:hypothetical protein
MRGTIPAPVPLPSSQSFVFWIYLCNFLCATLTLWINTLDLSLVQTCSFISVWMLPLLPLQSRAASSRCAALLLLYLLPLLYVTTSWAAPFSLPVCISPISHDEKKAQTFLFCN